MRRMLSLVVVFVLASGALGSQAPDPFGQALPRDRQAVHVLNRLAYGPQEQDLAQVRRLGATAWIRQQLEPARIPESDPLLARLASLESAALAPWEAFERYQPIPFPFTPPTPLPQLLDAAQRRTLESGNAAERATLFDALSPETRRQVFLVAPASAFNELPDVQVAAFNARQAETTRRNDEFRRLRPPLMDLLTADEIDTLTNGTDDERKLTLLTALDEETRAHVLRQLPAPAVPPAFRRQAMALRAPLQFPLSELVEAKLHRAISSSRQLEEVLVDFWLNHFNVFSGKGPIRMLLPSYERDAIRPHVLGRFRDMVLATARHPAMLFYLDNWLSQASRAGEGEGRPVGLNENYGRELLELHTLGVDGGYTQEDVVSVARAFTGWTIHEPERYAEFYFNPAMHDREEKVVLGHRIPRGGGESDGVTVIEILSRHPSTAQFIARKLAQRFVADDPPQRLVDRVAAGFLETDGDLRAVMTTLLLSPEFMSEGAWQAKVKSPLELVVSALRALDAGVTDTGPLANQIALLGQPLYGKAEPTGYPNTSEIWTSSASLIGRMTFAAAVTSGRIDGVTVNMPTAPLGDPAPVATRVLGMPPSRTTTDALQRGIAAVPSAATIAAILIASPDFQKR
jgi:uncharacterized protein (DUF1800 family)